MIPGVMVTCRVIMGLIAAFVCKWFWTPRVPEGKTSKNYNYDSNFIFRWRYYNKTWSVFVRHQLITPFEASLWMNVLYRLTTKIGIGKGAFLATDTMFRDHNFVEIGDDAVVGDEVILRTHTFEDWKLRFEKISIGPKCVVRPSTTIMSGASIGRESVVECNTLVMKNEYISGGSVIGGIPSCKLANIVLRSGASGAGHQGQGASGADDVGEKGPLLVYRDESHVKVPLIQSVVV
jgi:acetyltransferase-like isoleucine patch superfamily enzyme